MTEFVQALRRRFEFVETHISWVFLGATDVYKVKRPVDFGFLDFTTLEKRKNACQAEVRLNRRLAPDVYLGVVPVTVDAEGQYEFGGSGTTIDWAVHMTRLDDDTRADVLADQGELDFAHIDRLAAHLARFHQAARCDEETSRFGAADAIRTNVIENFEQTRDTIEKYLTVDEAREIEAWQRGFLKREEVFDARVAAQRVRDGHGDLRLEHVYFREDDTITVLDCIEFNDRFRYADVCSDIAFLSMDLAWRDHVALAERLLARYALETNDYDLYTVVDFYESYRAFVRGKIASFVANDAALSQTVRDRAAEQARRYFLLSLAFERPPLVKPVVIAVGGIIASGKSTVADALARELSAPVVSTDRTRKYLLGLRSTDSAADEAWSGAYAPDFSKEVYAEVLRRAESVLQSRRPVAIDASFRTQSAREAARTLAARYGVPFLLVECRPPIEVCRRRLEERDRKEGQVSDARADLLEEFAGKFEPVEELVGSEFLSVDTTQPLERNIAAILQRLTA